MRIRGRTHARSTPLIQHRADLVLLLVTLIMGATYPLLHAVTQFYPPLSLTALRFGLAALVMAPLLWPRRSARVPTLGQRGWYRALGLGGLLFLVYTAMTLGFQQTTVARGSFFFGLCAVLVPVLAFLLLRQRPRPGALAGLALAIMGLLILAGNEQRGPLESNLNWGDVLMLLAAVAAALRIVLIAAPLREVPALPLNAAQMIVAALLALPTALVSEGLVLPSPLVWGTAAVLGVIATALTFALQILYQPHTTATNAALILGLRPVLGVTIAALAGLEALTFQTITGGSLMLLGVIVATTLPTTRSATRQLATEVCSTSWNLPAVLRQHRIRNMFGTTEGKIY
jgi:drug/metabolite transporter (DMT)-like permease